MDVTRERISRILELREMLLSLQTGFNLVNAAVVGALLDSTDNNSIEKVETSLERQEHFSQFQDTTDPLPCHTHLPVCL